MAEGKQMTDEERLALAEKLDRELDEFIDGLEKKKYADGWSEETWEEEMAKHPFFMKNLPENTDNLDPLMEGLQKLKFDPNENTAEELASNYRDDGNFYIKHKKYRMAIMSYTEAIKQKCGNTELEAVLYNNRSAAHFFLKNYRSSLSDAQKALKLKPDYIKPKVRAAQCAHFLNKFELCLEYCDDILQEKFDNAPTLELRKMCLTNRTTKERDVRKRALEEKKREANLEKVLNKLKTDQIKFENLKNYDLLTEKVIQPKLAPLADFPVALDADDNLHWPTVFCYPELLTTDFQQQLDENVRLHDVLQDMFGEPLEFDKERKYVPNNLNVYYENRITAKLHLIDVTKTVKQILQEKYFLVIDGCLVFYILPKNLDGEREFLDQTRIPLHLQT